MEVPLRTLLDGFRSALAPGSGRVLTAVAVVAGLVILVAAGALWRSLRERGRRRALALRLFDRRVSEAGLDGEDRRALDALLKSLDRPLERKHHLLANPVLFHRTAEAAIGAGRVTPEQVAALRVHLGFVQIERGGTVRSTAEIAEGQPIRLRMHGGDEMPGTVLSTTERGLLVAPEQGSEPPAAGSPVSLIVATAAGTFTFHSEVIELVSGRLLLAHREHADHAQERRFFRKTTALPVVLIDPAGRSVAGAALTDLSGGGAAVDLPQPLAGGGEESRVELRIDLGGRRPVTAPARVARVSEGGRRLHLEFLGLSVRDQDRIVRHVLG